MDHAESKKSESPPFHPKEPSPRVDQIALSKTKKKDSPIKIMSNRDLFRVQKQDSIAKKSAEITRNRIESPELLVGKTHEVDPDATFFHPDAILDMEFDADAANLPDHLKRSMEMPIGS